jgi:hypothetical protein
MSTQQDVAEARRAVQTLAAAVQRLSSSQPDSVDLRRLTEDVGRVRVDLDLLAGTVASGSERTSDRDDGYDPREFGDGTYEGARPHHRR